ncbi:MAG: hypothetical protein E6K85_06185 [Thaumarchaeota archaeon]|nr:MAG: hypothetical protein E6K85_06185 [Nitrososphaerota archaeon]
MLPRFNELKLLAAAVRHKLGAYASSDWDCKVHGHFVPPDYISKKVMQRNFRFITDCWACKKRLLFDCAVNDNNELIANCREYQNSADLMLYFSDINNNNYRAMHEMHSHQPPHEDDHKLDVERQRVLSCRVCGITYSDVAKLGLCQAHTLEALLQLKFRSRLNFDQLIEELKNAHENQGALPSLVMQNKMALIFKIMLDTLHGKELADFVIALPNIIQKLEVITAKKS